MHLIKKHKTYKINVCVRAHTQTGRNTGSDTGKRSKNDFSLFDVFLQFCDN